MTERGLYNETTQSYADNEGHSTGLRSYNSTWNNSAVSGDNDFSLPSNAKAEGQHGERVPPLIDFSDSTVEYTVPSTKESICPVSPPQRSLTVEEALNFPAMPSSFSDLHLRSVFELTNMLESDEAIREYLATQPLYRHICSTRDNLLEETRYLEWKNTQALEKRDKFEMSKLKETKRKLKKVKEELAKAQKEKSELLLKMKPENLTKLFIPAVEEKLKKSEAIRTAFLKQEISLSEGLSEYVAERKAYYVRRAKTNFITALAKSI
ncbi:hypothetical protein GpartN1_g3132.t1 [Galdieria partita]|uniref:VPS37 C-terminal domain-containing protein n=1 Tax=Galdieria partita TaxID=83374 RepID=A0A9C7PWZ2_9RHOD|nr:hypothetical protein GpartN1_g3132.t1 [Galdieria partita]